MALPRLTEREMRRLEEIGRNPFAQVSRWKWSRRTNEALRDKGLVIQAGVVGRNDGSAIWLGYAALTNAGTALLSGFPEFEHLREETKG